MTPDHDRGNMRGRGRVRFGEATRENGIDAGLRAEPHKCKQKGIYRQGENHEEG